MASFSPVLEETIHRALTLASDRKHELATLEHLLLALLDDKDAAAVITACDVDIEPLRADVQRYLDEDLASLVVQEFEEARPTAGFHRVIQRAVIHVQSSGREEVTGANALVALFAERESHAVYFLQERDMTRYDAVNYISHGISKSGDGTAPKSPSGTDMPEGEDAKKKDPLEEYTVNLNQKAREGDIDPLIGRDEEVERCIMVLSRRRKNNPLLVGDPGVGKTAIAEGIARRIVNDECAGWFWLTPRFTRSTWALFWRAPATAVILKNGLKPSWRRNCKTHPALCCSLTKFIPLSVRAQRPAARWMRLTC